MKNPIRNLFGAFAGRLCLLCLPTLLLASLSSCDKVIYDYEGDCRTTYLVRFRYDYNMKWADAFAHEVECVTLYVIDQSGNIVWHRTEEGAALAEEGYAMTVDMAPGQYSLLAWCGTKDNGSYIVPDADKATDLTCTLDTKTDTDGAAYVDGEIDRLYYGYLADQTFGDTGDTYIYTVPLLKDTNSIRVVLQQMGGGTVDKDRFSFRITADNGMMDWDNSLIGGETLTYRAFYTAQGEAESEEGETFSAAIAEFTVGRLVEGHSARLSVLDSVTGETVFSIPLIDIALMVKGYYNRDLSDQEYLDRQDEYSLVFFLEGSGSWMDSYIYVNSWKVVLQGSGL